MDGSPNFSSKRSNLMKRNRFLLCLGLPLALCALLFLAWPAAAAPTNTIFVSTGVHEAPMVNNGNCTLGEAIHAANTNVAPALVARGFDVEIRASVFDSLSRGVLRLENGSAAIEKSRFYANHNAAYMIDSYGDMTIRDSAFWSSNSGVVQAISGTLTMERSTLAQNVSPHAIVRVHDGVSGTLRNVTIYDNRVSLPSAVYLSANVAGLTLENSIVTHT